MFLQTVNEPKPIVLPPTTSEIAELHESQVVPDATQKLLTAKIAEENTELMTVASGGSELSGKLATAEAKSENIL